MQKGVKHGFAVASGMVLATEFSFKRSYINIEEKERIIRLLERFKLVDEIDLTDNQMKKLVIHDKKKTGSDIHYVFTQGIGKTIVEKVPVDEILGFYNKFRDKK
jgi:3-dehydroquinate synthetase